MKLFKEENGTYSWRKILTALSGSLFGYSVIGHQIKSGFEELPSSYQAIIAGVFAFYFAKDVLRNMKITK